MVANQKRKPNRIPYAIGFAIIIAGVSLFVILLFSSISIIDDNPSAVSDDNDLVRLVMPGIQDITLEKSGKYTIYHEYKSLIDNRVYASPPRDISGLEIVLESRATGTPVPIRESSVSSTYSVGSRSGASLFDFDIGEPGTYKVSAFYPDGRLEPRLVLAVGHGFVGNIILTALQGIGILLGTFIAGFIIVIMTFFKRREIRN